MFGSPLQTVAAQSVVRWTVDYQDGSKRSVVFLPHAWRQDVTVEFEGPAVYRTDITVPRGEPHLVFERVCYAAQVSIDGVSVYQHEGLWDAFAVPLAGFAGRTVEVEVQVVKNGGASFPVKEVASGFLPYVYNTFGGIHGGVFLTTSKPVLDHGPIPSRVHIDGSEIFVDGQRFYMRGLLHWGWYPDLGHPTPTDETIRQELRDAKALGFNLIKFCLWVPSHRYLEILREEGLFAWMELPLWAPTDDVDILHRISDELEMITRQYRHHDVIIAWTVGCELGVSVPAEIRRSLTQTVRNLTGCPLVKDTSGGAEMYGEDLREFGDFDDFHPYCDTPFYPAVLDSLIPQTMSRRPVLLGEFNDSDVHRDLSRVGDEMPYWGSTLPELNAQGVRWQYDLPNVLDASRFSLTPRQSHHAELMESSRSQSLFIRKTVIEATRARGAIGGYVLTGFRDTPISSAGMFDDWGAPRFSASEVQTWNGPQALFLIPHRQPKWQRGGNRPGYRDPLNHFAGNVMIRVGIHSETSTRAGLVWRILDNQDRRVAASAEATVRVDASVPSEIGQIYWADAKPGSYTLEVEAADASNSWPLWVVAPWSAADIEGWSLYDPDQVLTDLVVSSGEPSGIISTRMDERTLSTPKPILGLMHHEGTRPAPFWREAAYEFRNDKFWASVPFAQAWSRLHAVSGDAVLDEAWLQNQYGDYEVLLNRVDVRTYQDSPVLVRTANALLTTLRPFGGLGIQPPILTLNPFGCELLRALLSAINQIKRRGS